MNDATTDFSKPAQEIRAWSIEMNLVSAGITEKLEDLD
jgi:hypothetical protein